MEERLQKILSARGVASRRAAEDWLAAGRVTVNGRTARVGDKADPERDEIRVDGRLLAEPARRTYVMLNKPRGYVTTLSDERGRKTVAELVTGCGARVWPVGRLDLDSEGLLLLTDDGALTQRLIHPSHEVEKEYHVRVEGDVAAALPVLTFPGYQDPAGNAYSHLETNDYTPLIEEYRAFQYNNLFGDEERADDLYLPAA